MNYRIDGGNLPVLKVRLSAGEQIECEAGAMSWMDDEIEMQTKAGGLGRMFGRSLKFVRCMPNTPALVGMGCTGVCCNEQVTRDEMQQSLSLLQSFGLAEEVPEKLMDAVVGVSGSCFWRHSQMEQYRQECREHRPTGSLHSPLWEAQPWHLKPGSIRES